MQIRFAEYDKETLVFLFPKGVPMMRYRLIVFGLLLSIITEIVSLSKGVQSHYPIGGIIFFLILYFNEYEQIAAYQMHRLAIMFARQKGIDR